jgi:hypothetical protein
MGQSAVNKRYVVMVDDNSHYMDESERYQQGSFDSCERAVVACKRIVDDFLVGAHRPGMREDELYGLNTQFGDDPYVISDDVECAFSAWGYAKLRCAELCGG